MADEYTAESIEILTSREAFRKRPGMYVGGTDDGTGAQHLLLEVLANAVDQVLLGRCTRIDIRVDVDDTVTITDDGPGIPARTLVDRLERLWNRPTVDGHRPHVHLGIGGLGLPVANALSDPFEVDTVHAGEQATITCAGGLQRVPLHVRPASRPSGTRIRFRPDPQLFSCTRVPRVELTRRLEDLAFLLPAATLSWSFAGERLAGLAGRVRGEVGAPLGDVAHHQADYATDDGPTTVEVALAWQAHTYSRLPQIHSFANLQRTESGMHVSGLLDGVRSFLKLRSARGVDRFVAAVAILLTDVRYGSPTKSIVINPSVRPAVKQATLTALQRWAERCPDAAAELRRRNHPRRA